MRIRYTETICFHMDTIRRKLAMLLNEMEIFYYVVELKSFSKAAERLSVSKSFISKKITKLEHDLKTILISRSTRKLSLTEAGESFYHYCANVVKEGQEAYSMMSGLHGKPVGTLKISMPPALGLNLIAPILPKFISQYPEVILDIELENRIVDILEEGYDLALRSAVLESSNLIAQRFFSIENIICASKKYFELNGIPKNPDDLESHQFATYSYSKKADNITLMKNNKEEVINIKSVFQSNQLDLIKQMVLNNVCLAILPKFMVENELKSRKLIACLSNHKLPESPIYAVYPERKFMLPKLKCFLDMLKQET